jgi:hypothetical protein
MHSILLVDDDNSPNNNGGPYTVNSVEEPTQKEYYQDSLRNLGYAYSLYVVPQGADGPDIATLQNYELVIWVCGYEWGYKPTLSVSDQINLGVFLDGGGKLWLDGPTILQDLYDYGPQTYYPGEFAYEYLHLDEGATDLGATPTPDPLVGIPGSAEEGNSYATISYWSQFGAPENYATETNPRDGAVGVYVSDNAYFPDCGAQWENGHQVFFTGAEWTFIVDPADRDSSMEDIFDWFFIPIVDYGCLFNPEFSAQDTTPDSVVSYQLNITNIGLTEPLDLFDLTHMSVPLGWTIEYFDEQYTALGDNNGNGNPDTGVLRYLGWKNIVVNVTVPPGANPGDVETTTIIARSSWNPSYFSQAILETTVPYYGPEWRPASIDGFCRANNYWFYTAVVRNTAGFEDTFDLTYTSPLGLTYRFYEADGETQLIDTGGGPAVDTGPIPPLTDREIMIKVIESLGNPPGSTDNGIVNATSVADPLEINSLAMDIFIVFEPPYFENAESGLGPYSTYTVTGEPEYGVFWDTTTNRSHAGSSSFWSGSEGNNLVDLAIESPYIFVPNIDAPSAKFDFWHFYSWVNASVYGGPDITDGGIVDCWDAGSQSWQQLTPEDGYDGIISPDYGNPLGDYEAFGMHSNNWQHETFNISNYLSTGPPS